MRPGRPSGDWPRNRFSSIRSSCSVSTRVSSWPSVSGVVSGVAASFMGAAYAWGAPWTSGSPCARQDGAPIFPAMGEAADTIRPVWRTRLAAALVAWMGLVIGATLASSRLLEVLPASVLPFAAFSLFITPIPIFLVWGFWTMLREPLTGWLAPTVVLAFCGGFVPAFKPLFDLGVNLNFAARRPAYEAIVDDVTSGRLAAAEGGGWTQGLRGDIRY